VGITDSFCISAPEKIPHLACFLARPLRYIHRHVSRYAPLDVPCRQTQIRRNLVESFLTVTLAVGKVVQKGKYLIRGNLFDFELTEILAESVNDGLIRSNGIFFRMCLVIIDPDYYGFGHFHGLPPSSNKGLTLGRCPM
jgi:hypothetical protein